MKGHWSCIYRISEELVKFINPPSKGIEKMRTKILFIKIMILMQTLYKNDDFVAFVTAWSKLTQIIFESIFHLTQND